ncbi:MAG TPA: LysR substrate-binding domain-containing protein [Nocardioides sp.]|uniref:LysR substrate-binding domain-containing protein n=1 Tax=Nocardioides sp. TaxID=35761 RepID=UPI002C2FDBBC|nr:LysR substrate-binding domain-containing protein [Nocardioides sp.]HTW15509.1 LysR substrate-binding domain-containing protein [Nocardioides sp.]
MLPDLPSLRLLADVARHGSIGAAGRVAGISQQSASERLRAMEAQTGLVLVQRAASGSSLTSAGRLLVEWSTRLLEQADEVEVALRTLRQERTEELRVFASMTTAEYLLPRWLVRLRQQRSVTVSLHATNSEAVLGAVRSGEAGLGFVEGPGDLSGLASRAVGDDELMLVAAPDDPWARRRRPLDAAAVAARPLTSRERGSGTRGVIEDAMTRAGAALAPPEAELTTNAAVVGSVRAGSPPAFVSRRAVERDLDSGLLVAVPTTGLDLRRRFTAVWVGGRTPPAGPVRDLLAIAGRG